ncbi:RNA polymerase sigma-70 factor [Mariniphaga sediminis]|uniref:RNA polymerase sigma-70 factor n=1 Tax=Mariniphaga sediminis TaxID=1628158 RepID=A0A399CSZ2_9BACT|nr:RNA polymerase sigma-70 factor [Mariniphaga sediminis]RIH63105.1 RNA polymerase sigma-70 factor [Mariniphaga sediminis]
MTDLEKYQNTDLLQQLKKSSPFAFQVLFDKYSQKIYRFSLSYLKDKAEAEEIVQEVFMKIWSSRNELVDHTSFESFLFTMAKNAILNTLRKSKYHQAYLEYSKLHPGKNVLLDEELDFNELNRAYQKSVEGLSPRRREIYCLSKEKNLSNAEIAKKMDISVKTVENQMTAALAEIKKNLRSLGFSGIIFFELFI